MGAGLKKKIGFINKYNGMCFWCGRQCKIVKGNVYSRHRGRRLPKRAATIDHLFNKLESNLPEHKRRLFNNAVLSCYDCNQRKGLEAQIRYRRLLRLKLSLG